MTEQQKTLNRELLHQILDVVLDINGLESRRIEKTGSLPTAFFEFCGHIGTASARIAPYGWESGEYGEKFNFSTDRPIKQKDIDRLLEVKNMALNVKTKSEILEHDMKKKEKDISKAKDELNKLRASLVKARKEERKMN